MRTLDICCTGHMVTKARPIAVQGYKIGSGRNVSLFLEGYNANERMYSDSEPAQWSGTDSWSTAGGVESIL